MRGDSLYSYIHAYTLYVCTTDSLIKKIQTRFFLETRVLIADSKTCFQRLYE